MFKTIYLRATCTIFFLLLLSWKGVGQDSIFYEAFPLIEGRVNYTRIFEVDSLKKEHLFTKIKDWAVNSYKSQKATLQAEDKEAGYIAYKGFLPLTLTYSSGMFKGKPYQVDLYHTLKFYIKDGKVKIVFTDLETQSRDAASEYLVSTTGKPTDKIPLENYGKELEKISVKKREKWVIEYKQKAKKMNNQIVHFLDLIISDIRNKKSEFDF